MNKHEEKIELMRKYASKIATNFNFHIKGDIPSKIIDNALKKFANGIDRKTIIGFYDTTLMNNGKSGYIFTDTKIYYLETLEKPKKLWYDDIKSIELSKEYESKDCDKEIVFKLFDGSEIRWNTPFMNKTPLLAFFNDMLKLINNVEEVDVEEINYKKEFNSGIESAGQAIANKGTVNKLFEEEKFNARQGHGFAAERANNLFDSLTGHEANIIGDDNAKNGADRILDGVSIQSKYCATGSRCINECFENDGKGAFRYLTSDGKPMVIEVPSDKYEAAIEAMEEKIRRGQVSGVNNPEDAKKIVKKGHFTYSQARNIAKAGTVESITYDSVNGVIIASSALGISAVLTFANSIWNGEDLDVAVKNATYSGLKVGGTTFITSVLASQLSKAGLNSALVGSSEAVINVLGPKASAMLINAFRNGSNIYGAAAMKSAAKLLRGNVITAGVTIVVLSSFDIANIFRGRISGKQLFKNLTNTASTVAGGTAGWVGGAAAGAAIGSVVPIIGTGIGSVVGGLAGSVMGGSTAGKISDKVMGTFIEDDANEMIRIIEKEFQILAVDYLLNQKEAEKSVDALQVKLDGKILKDMYASSNRKEFANDLLNPIIENEVSKRKKIQLPSIDKFGESIKEILEEIADTTLQNETEK